MRFTVEVRRNADGRLEGTIGVTGGQDVPFTGVIELVGLIEARLDAGDAAGRPGGTGGRAAGIEA
ncbi:MAG TPA: hypothetical protein VFU73_08245 [Actinocrinis sp.]|nr:hypothetical protein [Actinocrinis sp.]